MCPAVTALNALENKINKTAINKSFLWIMESGVHAMESSVLHVHITHDYCLLSTRFCLNNINL